jgi:hypothetical protein
MSRSDRREKIFRDDLYRGDFPKTLGAAVIINELRRADFTPI